MNEALVLLPEILLVATLAGVVAGEIGYHGEKLRLVRLTALIGLAAALIEVPLTHREATVRVFSGALTIDGLSQFFRLFFIVLAVLVVIYGAASREIARSRRTEYFGLVVGATLGMSLLSCASDVLLLVTCFGLVNLAAHVMAGYAKNRVESAEAGFKYLVFGVASTACMLYCVALLFSVTGSFNMYEMGEALARGAAGQAAVLTALILLVLSLGFLVGSFPMHAWVPDVVEGAPSPTSVFLAVGMPACGFVVLLRFLIIVFGLGHSQDGWALEGIRWREIIALLAAVSMILGALLAFRQNGAKRMLGCVAIVQSGLLMMAIPSLDRQSLSALLYTLIVGLFSYMGAFVSLSRFLDKLGSDQLSDFGGLLVRRVPEAIVLLVFLGSLLGIPPFPGFIGRFLLIRSTIEDGWYSLAAVAVGTGILLIVAFARVSANLARPAEGARGTGIELSNLTYSVTVLTLLVPLLILTVFPAPVLAWSERLLAPIFW